MNYESLTLSVIEMVCIFITMCMVLPLCDQIRHFVLQTHLFMPQYLTNLFYTASFTSIFQIHFQSYMNRLMSSSCDHLKQVVI